MGGMSTAAERCIEKWHARDCDCTESGCATREAARERLALLGEVTSNTLRKAGWSA